MNRRMIPLLLLTAMPVAATPLQETRKPDPAYQWSTKSTARTGDVTMTELELTSQNWRGGDWRHRVRIFRPASLAHPDFCVLFVSGSGNGAGENLIGTALAQSTGCAVATLLDVPNQPLYGGKREDELIAYTWTEYLKTGDETWPLQMPMVESTLRAMDAVQAAARSAGLPAVKRFLVTGASKRGWTSWLAAATGDPRIVAVAPMVIDTLNIAEQLPHQLASYGKASEQIADYERAGLFDALQTPRGKQLLAMVDPYAYRKALTLPKLVILGTNDRYWAQDALNLYWNGLSGRKWVLYTPNSGHGLDDRVRVLATLSAFVRSAAAKKPLPSMTWKWNGNRLSVKSGDTPTAARLWTAAAPTRDFRDARWSSKELRVNNGSATADVPAPASGYVAGFVELGFPGDGKPYTLSTQLSIRSAGAAATDGRTSP